MHCRTFRGAWVSFPTALLWLSVGAGCSDQQPKAAAPASLPAASAPASQAASRPTGPAKTLILDLGAGVRMDLVLIPAGSFLMGSSKVDQAEAQAEFDAWKEKNNSAASVTFTNEGPQHLVIFDQPFYMGRHAVTNQQYRCFKPNHDSGTYRGVSLNGDTQPVVNVNWDEAQAFCLWLSQKTGQAVSLPSESQREYVMRGGDGRQFPWGNEWPPPAGAGNYADETVRQKFEDLPVLEGYTDGYVVTAPVGCYRPNPYGLCDLGGNVWEWCLDTCHDTYEGAPTNGTAWEGASADRSVRGGSWVNLRRRYLRAACRDWRAAGERGTDVGFRVVVTPAEKP